MSIRVTQKSYKGSALALWGLQQLLIQLCLVLHLLLSLPLGGQWLLGWPGHQCEYGLWLWQGITAVLVNQSLLKSLKLEVNPNT